MSQSIGFDNQIKIEGNEEEESNMIPNFLMISDIISRKCKCKTGLIVIWYVGNNILSIGQAITGILWLAQDGSDWKGPWLILAE